MTLCVLPVFIPAGPAIGAGATALMRALPGRPLVVWQILVDVVADALVLAVLLLGLRFMERQPAAAAGLARRDVLLGFSGGAVLMAAIVGTLAAAGWYRASVADAPAGAAASLALFLLAAVSEEVRFRAIAFRLVERALGTWIAVAGSALLFGVSHLGSPHATPASALAWRSPGPAGHFCTSSPEASGL